MVDAKALYTVQRGNGSDDLSKAGNAEVRNRQFINVRFWIDSKVIFPLVSGNQTCEFMRPTESSCR